MTRKHYSIDQLSTTTSRQARNELAILQGDLKKLRDSISNQSRSINQPTIKASHNKTKKTTSTSIWSGLAGMGMAELAGNGLLGDNVSASGTVKIGGASFTNSGGTTSSDNDYTSNAQATSSLLSLLSASQRVR